MLNTVLGNEAAWLGIRLTLFGMAITIGMYWLSRSRHYRVSAVLLVIQSMVVLFVAILASAPGYDLSVTLVYMIVPILLTGILFSPRAILLTALFCIVAILFILPSFVSFSNPDRTIRAIYFIGAVSGLILVFVRHHNLSESDRQRGLEESERQYRLLAENSTDIIARTTIDGVVLYISPAVKTLLGYEPETLIGKTRAEISHPDDVLNNGSQIRSGISSTLNTFTYTHRLRHRDGHYLWFETIARPVRDPQTNHILELHISSRDITERRLMEEALTASETRYRQLVEEAA